MRQILEILKRLNADRGAGLQPAENAPDRSAGSKPAAQQSAALRWIATASKWLGVVLAWYAAARTFGKWFLRVVVVVAYFVAVIAIAVLAVALWDRLTGNWPDDTHLTPPIGEPVEYRAPYSLEASQWPR